MSSQQQELLQQTQYRAEQMLIKYVHCSIPVMTKEKVAHSIGLTVNQVNDMLAEGVFPSYQVGRIRLVNLARLFIRQDLLPSVLIANPTESEMDKELLLGTPKRVVPMLLPCITKERFADLVGTSPSAVQGWINRGYVPTAKTGKYRLIDLTKLFSECLA